MKKHTDGPWLADPFGRDTYIVKDFGNGCARHIATVRHPEDVPVIQQAPELFDVLSQIMADLPSRRDWLDPVLEQRAKAAIATATDKGK